MKKSTKIKGIVFIVLLVAILAFLFAVIVIEEIEIKKAEEASPKSYYMEEYTYTDEYGDEMTAVSGSYRIENNEISIRSLAESMYPHADIPSEINGVKVTSLGSMDYPEYCHYYGYGYNSYLLVSVNIPDSVTILGNQFFSGAQELVSVTGGEGLTVIGTHGFMGCSSLEEITLYPNLTTIGEWAFSSCRELEEITIPDSVVSIGNKAFFGCNITVTAPHEPEYYGYTPDPGVTWIVGEENIIDNNE